MVIVSLTWEAPSGFAIAATLCPQPVRGISRSGHAWSMPDASGAAPTVGSGARRDCRRTWSNFRPERTRRRSRRRCTRTCRCGHPHSPAGDRGRSIHSLAKFKHGSSLRFQFIRDPMGCYGNVIIKPPCRCVVGDRDPADRRPAVLARDRGEMLNKLASDATAALAGIDEQIVQKPRVVALHRFRL